MCSCEPASFTDTSLDANLLDRELTTDDQAESSALGVAQDEHSAGTASPTDFPQRKPVRVIHDPYSDFSSVAVDPAHNEVVVTDENLFNLLVYDRTANTPPNKVNGTDSESGRAEDRNGAGVRRICRSEDRRYLCGGQ